MAASATAAWLDSFFFFFFHFFLNILFTLGDKAGVVLTPLMRVITFLGEKGIVFFLLALIFMLTADRRDLGVCIFGAVCCGALISNIILKDSVGRVRPYEAVAEYNAWWQALGAPSEDGCSFPSGHVTACAAGMTAITLMRGKKWILPSVLIVFFMGVSRNYLMAHYPSDVLFAVIIGVFSGVVAWLITQLIFRFLRRHRQRSPICAALLDYDIRDVLPLPALPAGRGDKKKAKPSGAELPPRRGASRSQKTVPGRRGTARPQAVPSRRTARAQEPVEQESPDDDVKTYTGSGRQASPAAAEKGPIFEQSAPRRSRAESDDTEGAPRSARAESSESESGQTLAQPETGEAEAAPRRTRSGGAHGISSRASSGTGGRHVLNAAGESAPRASRRRTLPGTYQGKHVK